MPYRVEIRKGRRSRKFDSSRYPGFAYRKTGKYAYHWEAVVDDAGLQGVRDAAARDGYDMTAVPLEYTRSSGYRAAFIAADPGPYRCRYCNRRLGPDSMTVDHLVPVAMAKRSALARRALAALGATEGVNDVANLAPACTRCNARKSDKGGLWIARGLLGRHRLYWLALRSAQAALAALAAWSAWRAALDPGGVADAVRSAATEAPALLMTLMGGLVA